MIPAAFDYRRATTVEEALALLSGANGRARLLAGGHSLVPLMKLRLSEPELLIDIARITALRGIRGGDPIAVGATTTQAEIAASEVLRRDAPALSDAAGAIGDPQVRNRGTIGGSIAHADPAADLPAPLVALDAQIEIARSTGGRRTVAAADFFRDIFTVDLEEDEMITEIRVAPQRASAYAKLHQRASHFALVGVAASLDIDGGVCRAARIAVTGLASHAQRLPAVEAALTGKRLEAATIGAAALLAAEGVRDVNTDIHGSADYRRRMAAVFAGRAITAALSRA